MKKIFLMAAVALVACAASAQVPMTEARKGDIWTKCPEGTTHFKIEGNDQSSQTITAPEGYVIVQTQVKAGNVDWGYGSGGHQPPVSYDPGESEVVVSSADRHDISHVHVCKVAGGGPTDEPRCDPSTFGWQQTSFSFGFTENIHAPEGAGCSSPDVFAGKPGDQVRFDICLDGVASGTGVVVEPKRLPYHDSAIITVAQQSSVVEGFLDVVVMDPRFEGCETRARYSWIGSVAADTDSTTEICYPHQPCWCESVPEDPRCQERCPEQVGLMLGYVEGWVDAETCYDALTPLALDTAVSGNVTLCWRASGGPGELSVSANLNGKTFPGLPTQGHTWIGGDEDLHGRFTAISRGETCSAAAYSGFSILRQIPPLCVAFLP